MKIGIDARPLVSEKLTGIGVYVYEVLKYLIETDQDNDYILYTHLPLKCKLKPSENFRVKMVKGRWKVGTLKFMFGLPGLIRKDRLDVYWGTEQYLPLKVNGVRYVLTVHDLALLIKPEWGSRTNRMIQKFFTPGSVRRADLVLAVSEATKKDVVRICKKNPGQIRVVYSAFTPQEDADAVCMYAKPPFFLFVGTIEPRKNIETIIKAFEIIAAEDAKIRLVIAGGMGWEYKPVLQLLENSACRERITRTGFVTNNERARLYNEAAALVFPSHYEGFGIPVLEGMSAKTLVITSKNSSLPEVGGEAALYIEDENDAGALAALMRQVMKMDSEERKERIELGLAQCRKFSWEKCALEVKEALLAREPESGMPPS